ncbi:MAG: DUF5777 family beta-barrel protein [Bacteroidota bacterium]
MRDLLLCLLLVNGSMFALVAQPDTTASNDALAELEAMNAEAGPVRDYTLATFKAERIINMPSTKTTNRGDLVFLVQHRFGAVNQGWRDLFGLDNANTRLGFEYGISDWLSIGIGRSSFQKYYDGFAKVKLLRQQTGKRNIPVTLAINGGVGVNTEEARAEIYSITQRMDYATTVMLARKFTKNLSLQLSGTLLHRNLVRTREDVNTMILPGIGGRYKFGKRFAVTAEYQPLLHEFTRATQHSVVSVGVDIETGGHVFQLLFSNATAMTPQQLLAHTSDDWLDGDIHFGFNLVRVFKIGGKREWEEEE